MVDLLEKLYHPLLMIFLQILENRLKVDIYYQQILKYFHLQHKHNTLYYFQDLLDYPKYVLFFPQLITYDLLFLLNP